MLLSTCLQYYFIIYELKNILKLSIEYSIVYIRNYGYVYYFNEIFVAVY